MTQSYINLHVGCGGPLRRWVLVADAARWRDLSGWTLLPGIALWVCTAVDTVARMCVPYVAVAVLTALLWTQLAQGPTIVYAVASAAAVLAALLGMTMAAGIRHSNSVVLAPEVPFGEIAARYDGCSMDGLLCTQLAQCGGGMPALHMRHCLTHAPPPVLHQPTCT
jgi:hypothetical protein